MSEDKTRSNFKLEFETRLRELIAAGDADAVVTFASEELVKSFKNGIAAGRSRAEKQQ